MLVADTVVITGASSGFGEAFARRMAHTAARQANEQPTRLILIARSKDRLQALAAELRNETTCTVEVWPCDLSAPADRAKLLTELSRVRGERMCLINNAGLGDYGEFASSEPSRNHSMIEVNMTALTELTRTMLSVMQKREARLHHQHSLTCSRPRHPGLRHVRGQQGICGLIQ